ncbi:MAG: DMT family transporter, partial [Candidatus Obscuribacterales bacterium]|nr:DMT family transporter [Candidatus Obscuribacterales bacterium]
LQAMSAAEASFVLGITAAYPIVFQFLASLFLGEALVPERILGALIIGLGLLFISSSAGSALSSTKDDSPQIENQLAERKSRWKLALCVFLATFCWGVYGLCDKKAVSCAPPLMVFVAKAVWDSLLFFVLLFIYNRLGVKLDWRNRQAWLYCSFSELALGLGGLSYLMALGMASASYVITITGAYPLLMYLFALWFLKEKFNKLRFAGIIFVVIGALLVQLTAA